MCGVFFIYTFHLLSFWALQSQRRQLAHTYAAHYLCVSLCVCLCVLAAIVVVAIAIVVIRAARFTESADRSPLAPAPPFAHSSFRSRPRTLVSPMFHVHGFYPYQLCAPPPCRPSAQTPLPFTFCPQPLTMARWANTSAHSCAQACSLAPRAAARFNIFF